MTTPNKPERTGATGADRRADADRRVDPDRPGGPGHAAGQTPMQSRADDAADVEGKDIVQLGSEGSFPASDPPSWMGSARPGGREPGLEPPHEDRAEPAEGPRQTGGPGEQRRRGTGGGGKKNPHP